MILLTPMFGVLNLCKKKKETGLAISIFGDRYSLPLSLSLILTFVVRTGPGSSGPCFVHLLGSCPRDIWLFQKELGFCKVNR
jgi:hypothetical protein